MPYSWLAIPSYHIVLAGLAKKAHKVRLSGFGAAVAGFTGAGDHVRIASFEAGESCFFINLFCISILIIRKTFLRLGGA